MMNQTIDQSINLVASEASSKWRHVKSQRPENRSVKGVEGWV